MRLLSDEGAVQWISEAGLRADGVVPYARAATIGAVTKRLRIRIPDEATAVVGLAYMIALTTVKDYEEDLFPGAVLWLQRWEIWSESIDRAGYTLLNGIRASAGRSVPISSAPAHLFEVGEFAAAHAALTLPMLFQWDARFVAGTGAFAAHISHEGSLDLVSRDAEVHLALAERFQQWEPDEVPAS